MLLTEKIMTELIYCYGKIEKSKKVDENFIFPSYGDKVNEFNKFLIVRDVENKYGKIYIKLEDE
jgi:hypothetical protein